MFLYRRIFIGMLSEGVIKIKPKERESLRSYVSSLKAFVKKILENGPMPAIPFLQELNSEFAPRWRYKVAKHLRTIDYEFDKNKRNGSYTNDGEWITLNLYYLALAKAGKEGILIAGLDYDKLIPILLHEFAHYKQDMKLRSKQYGRLLQYTDHPNLKSYFRDPGERQAWAIGHVEKLRRQMNSAKPEDILMQLRKVGLLDDPHLQALKQSDYDSWKSIMKNAVMTALHDINQGKI